jgi:hypothetical protein
MKGNIVFEEVGRIAQTDEQDLVVAKMKDKSTDKLTAYFINYHIKDWNGGPVKKPLKGVKVSESELVDFLKFFDKELLEEALNA